MAPTAAFGPLRGLNWALKVVAACALRWGDVELKAGTLTVRFACGTRTVEIPPSVRPLLEAGAPGRKAGDRLFAG